MPKRFVQVSLRVPDDLYNRLCAVAAVRGAGEPKPVSISSLMIEAARKLVEESADER
jgi:hypothetical protein